MDQQEQRPPLITGTLAAVIAVVLTGYVGAKTVRAAFWQSEHHFHWLIPLDNIFPHRAVLAVNVVFYVFMVFLCVVFPLSFRGKERILVAGWVPGVLLSPIQGFVSTSIAAAVQYFKAAAIMVSFFAAVAILMERAQNRAKSNRSVPQ